jgi:dTMP kinase
MGRAPATSNYSSERAFGRKPMALFFSFDGIDGVGKSTQLRLFCDWLTEQGRAPTVCRDPGSTPLGERIRELLLSHDASLTIGPRSEMLLYMAARAQLVEEVIQPALQAGRIVVCDRFLLANIVYQGYAGGLNVSQIRQVGEVAVAGTRPECTFLLDMDPAAALSRMGRELDRVESRGPTYRDQLRAGFLTEAELLGPSVHVIQADRSIDLIQKEIRAIAEPLIADSQIA